MPENVTIPPLEIVILAAGKGSRMKSQTPKVLHKVAGKALLEHILDTAVQLNAIKIHVVIGHKKEQILEHFSNYPAEINWVEQNSPNGTGDAVKRVIPSIDEASAVLMLTADVPLLKADTLTQMHASMAAFPLALLTAIVPDATGLGRIIRSSSGDVSGIIEHADASPEQRLINEINSGILCARAKPLKKWLEKLSSQNAQQEEYLTDIVAIANGEGNPVVAFQPQDVYEVQGINDRVQLAMAERQYQRQQAEMFMRQGVTIIDPQRIDIRGDVNIGEDTIIDVNTVIIGPSNIGKNVTIAPNCVITASDIGNNSNIHANTVIEQTVVGEQVNVGPFARLRPGTTLDNEVRIGNFVETKNAKLAKGAKVNHLSYVGDASVGRNTNIGAGVITCNYDGAYKHKTTIGNDVFVGSDSQLVAPVEIKDGATIGAGTTVTNNVGENKLAISRTKQREIDGWQRPKK